MSEPISTAKPIAEQDSPSSARLHRLGLMPKQFTFVSDDDHRELLYSGAFGAGKTRALCIRAVRLAGNFGARVGLCRKTLADLKASTLVTLLEPDGNLPAILPPGTYVYKKAEGRIHINGGGEIVLFGCDKPSKVASRPFTDILVDEAIELDGEEYDMLLGRIRVGYTMPNGERNTNSIASATNPGAPLHFLHQRFYEEKNPVRLLIETHTAENFHLSPAYVESLNELTGPARDRYFQGLWVAYEGAVYWMFDTAVHVKVIERPEDNPWDYFVAGVDVGFTNPSVIRVHACELSSRRSHVVAEFYEKGIVGPELVEACVAIQARVGALIVFVVDPSAADLAAQMRNLDLEVRHPPTRDVLQGIRCVQGSLLGSDPLLTMDPSCKSGNREYMAYRWKDKAVKEEPVKEMDHAVDADRYARTYIAAGLGEPVGLISLGRRQPSGRLDQAKPKGPTEIEGQWNSWNPMGDASGLWRQRR